MKLLPQPTKPGYFNITKTVEHLLDHGIKVVGITGDSGKVNSFFYYNRKIVWSCTTDDTKTAIRRFRLRWIEK